MKDKPSSSQSRTLIGWSSGSLCRLGLSSCEGALEDWETDILDKKRQHLIVFTSGSEIEIFPPKKKERGMIIRYLPQQPCEVKGHRHTHWTARRSWRCPPASGGWRCPCSTSVGWRAAPWWRPGPAGGGPAAPAPSLHPGCVSARSESGSTAGSWALWCSDTQPGRLRGKDTRHVWDKRPPAVSQARQTSSRLSSVFLTVRFVFERLAALDADTVAVLWRFVEAVGPAGRHLQAAAPTSRLPTRPLNQVLHPHHHLPGHRQNLILKPHNRFVPQLDENLSLCLWYFYI